MRKKLRQMTAISVELCERDAAWERARRLCTGSDDDFTT